MYVLALIVPSLAAFAAIGAGVYFFVRGPQKSQAVITAGVLAASAVVTLGLVGTHLYDAHDQRVRGDASQRLATFHDIQSQVATMETDAYEERWAIQGIRRALEDYAKAEEVAVSNAVDRGGEEPVSDDAEVKRYQKRLSQAIVAYQVARKKQLEESFDVLGSLEHKWPTVYPQLAPVLDQLIQQWHDWNDDIDRQSNFLLDVANVAVMTHQQEFASLMLKRIDSVLSRHRTIHQVYAEFDLRISEALFPDGPPMG